MENKKKNARQLLYVTTHEKIKEIIAQKALQPGDQIPSENELVSLLDVSRGTLRQALMLLRESGVIYNHQGKGNFLVPIDKSVAGLEKVHYDLTQFAIVPIDKKELAVDFIVSSASVQKDMEQDEATLMARFQIQFYSKEEIVAYRVLFVPYKMLDEEKVTMDDAEEMLTFIENLAQKRFVSAVMKIDYVQAREAVAKMMHTSSHAHLVCASEVFRDKTHQTVAYSKFYCHPEYFKFTINRNQK